MPGKAAALRIAMMGTRGVPARYSGFETMSHATMAGEDMTVEWPNRPSRYRGRHRRKASRPEPVAADGGPVGCLRWRHGR